MPNRYIREGIIESESVNALSWHAEVFYRRLMNRVDDFGRFTAHPSLLLASIFPLQLGKVSDRDINRLLDECESVGLVFRYEDGAKRFLVLNKWEKGRASTSQYPEPPEEIRKRMQTFVYSCKHPPANVPDPDSDSDTDAESVSPPPLAEAPTLAEWHAEAQRYSIYPAYAEEKYHYFDRSGWHKIRNWRACMKQVKAWFEGDGRPNGKNGEKPTAKYKDV